MIQRFLAYCHKVFALPQICAQIKDGRSQPVITGDVLWQSLLLIFYLRVGSLNALEEMFRNPARRPWWQRFLGGCPPSADTLGYYAARVACDSLRQVLQTLYTRQQRNRHLHKYRIGGWLLLAIDGHELSSSYRRCCPECLQRTLQTTQGERIQYYHRVVAAYLVGGSLTLPLDLEMMRPGEDEIGAAVRSQETKRVKGAWVTSDWYWVTTFSRQEASTETIWRGGAWALGD